MSSKPIHPTQGSITLAGSMMAASQIYISYARLDNAPPPDNPGGKGFVSVLVEQLEYESASLGSAISKLWQNPSPFENKNPFAALVAETIAASSVMIVVLSPNWIASKSCRLELQLFRKRWENEPDSDFAHRIIVVGKRSVAPEERPAFLSNQEEFNFYTYSGGEERELLARGKFENAQSFMLVRRLANTLVRLTRQPPAKSARSTSPDNAAKGTVILPDFEPDPDPPRPRDKAAYWLHRVAVERQLSPGDEPLVIVSFASEDQAWVDELHTFLEPRLDELRDIGDRPYLLWNFAHAKRGTMPGDEFPEIVAEKMWRCRAAIILLSRDYFKSSYCKEVELPFLMWRRYRHEMMCLPVKLGTVPIDRVKIPEYDGASRSVNLSDIIDDRQAAIGFATSQYRDLNMKELKEKQLWSEIEKRFDGVARHVADFLKMRHGATTEE
jgi:hypothetical protein